MTVVPAQACGRWRWPGCVAAGWIGVAAGLVDATAAALHPVSAVVVPFAVAVYALWSLILYGLLDGSRRVLSWLRPPAAPPAAGSGAAASPGARIAWPLGGVIAFWLTFFVAYAVTTSGSARLASRTGQMLGLTLALVLGLLGWIVTRAIVRRLARRQPAPRAGGRRPLGRFGPAVVLVLVVLVYPVLALQFQLQSSNSGPPGGSPSPRGFILVSLDAGRGDRISALGYPRPTTPEIDKLIQGGTAFRRAIVQQPASGPGHSCMLTGLAPLSHGVVANAHTLGDSVLTLAERLRAAGYHTAAFIDNFYLESRFGFAQGFDTFIDQYRASRLTDWNPQLLLRGLSLYQSWYRLAHRPGQRNNDTIDLCLSWLNHRPRGDFFVFLHLMDPHSPYDPPADLRERFYHPVGPPVADTEALRRRIKSLTPVEVAALRDLYDGDVAFADRKVGWLVERLRRLGLLGSTLLVVTADHGEVLYEKEQLFDHGTMWDGNLEVPLVFHYPGKVPAGTVIDWPVAAAALVPTSLALLGVPYADQTGQDFYPSLLVPPQATAQAFAPAKEPDPNFVFTLGGVGKHEAAAVTGDRYKLITRLGRITDLYDLILDRTEQINLWPQLVRASADSAATDQNTGLGPGEDLTLRELALRMKEALDQWLVRTSEAAVGLDRQAPANVDQDTARRLKALGY